MLEATWRPEERPYPPYTRTIYIVTSDRGDFTWIVPNENGEGPEDYMDEGEYVFATAPTSLPEAKLRPVREATVGEACMDAWDAGIIPAKEGNDA